LRYIDEPVKLQREILKKSSLLTLLPLFYLLITGETATLLGLATGFLIAVLIFRLKLLNIERSLYMGEKRAVNFIRNRYFIEYIIYFVVLFVARKNPSVNFIAAAVGLFMIKLTVIGMMTIDLLKEGWQKRLS
jgi:predicted membrane protein